MVNRTASIGLAVALAPLGVLAQTGQPAASASAASAIPRTGAGAGLNAARTRRRGTAQAMGAGDRRPCAPSARDPQSKPSGRGTRVRTRICARTRTGSLAARTGVFIRVNRELFSHEQGIFLALRGISQPGRHGYRRFSFDAERSPSARCRDPRCPPDSARPCRASKQGATVRRCRGGKRARRPCPRIRNEAQPTA